MPKLNTATFNGKTFECFQLADPSHNKTISASFYTSKVGNGAIFNNSHKTLTYRYKTDNHSVKRVGYQGDWFVRIKGKNADFEVISPKFFTENFKVIN